MKMTRLTLWFCAAAMMLSTAMAADLRIGIAASRKVGGAVVRNRIRRRLKAIARDLAPHLPAGTDMLIGVRPEAADATSDQLRASLVSCLRRAKLIEVSK